MWSFVVFQHPPAPPGTTQATGEVGIWLLIMVTALPNRTPGEGNPGPIRVISSIFSNANAVLAVDEPPERPLLSGHLPLRRVCNSPSSLLRFTARLQLVPCDSRGYSILPKDSSLKILNGFPEVLDVSARVWVPRTLLVLCPP